MDGGVDKIINEYFGGELQARVQRRIAEEYLGEQPIGTSLIVETGSVRYPFLAHTPTMEVPASISNTTNVYRAMRGMLLAVRKHNQTHTKQIRYVACPGLGTGSGLMSYQEAARQMALAYQRFLNPPTHIDWNYVMRRDGELKNYGKA
jgi:O-acetyl-ADP-ribose deacetylase (regulator of RNase III)